MQMKSCPAGQLESDLAFSDLKRKTVARMLETIAL